MSYLLGGGMQQVRTLPRIGPWWKQFSESFCFLKPQLSPHHVLWRKKVDYFFSSWTHIKTTSLSLVQKHSY